MDDLGKLWVGNKEHIWAGGTVVGWALGREGSPARTMGGGECCKHDAMEYGRDVADILPSGVSQENEWQKQFMVVACECPQWLSLDFSCGKQPGKFTNSYSLMVGNLQWAQHCRSILSTPHSAPNGNWRTICRKCPQPKPQLWLYAKPEQVFENIWKRDLRSHTS